MVMDDLDVTEVVLVFWVMFTSSWVYDAGSEGMMTRKVAGVMMMVVEQEEETEGKRVGLKPWTRREGGQSY